MDNNNGYYGEQMPPNNEYYGEQTSSNNGYFYEEQTPSLQTFEDFELADKNAKTAMIWGVLSIVLNFFGIILGIIAIVLGKNAQSLNPEKGKGGITCGIFGIVLFIFLSPVHFLMFIFIYNFV